MSNYPDSLVQVLPPLLLFPVPLLTFFSYSAFTWNQTVDGKPDVILVDESGTVKFDEAGSECR